MVASGGKRVVSQKIKGRMKKRELQSKNGRGGQKDLRSGRPEPDELFTTDENGNKIKGQFDENGNF